MHLKFCVLFLLLQSHNFPDYVFEELLITDCVLALIHDLEEHVLQPYHKERNLLKGELYHPHHDEYEVLHPALIIWQFAELLLNLCQFWLEDHSANMSGGVFLKRLLEGLTEVLFGKV